MTDEAFVGTSGQGPGAPQPDLTSVVVPLLKGVIYREEDAAQWAAMLQLQSRVRDHVAVMALDLVVDEAEGYAFLRSRPQADDGASPLPRLVRRQPLSFQVSLLLALLRKKLAEFDASGGDTRLILTRSAVVELVRVFLPAGSNESRLIDQIETQLNKVIDLGFVRRLKAQVDSAGGARHARAGVRGASHSQGVRRCPVAGRLRPATGRLPGTTGRNRHPGAR